MIKDQINELFKSVCDSMDKEDTKKNQLILTRAKQMAKGLIDKSICDCEACDLKPAHRVTACGDVDADIMCIGEAPGEHEDAQGIPFVGPAGQLFDDILEAIKWPRNSLYITNTVKCRPSVTIDGRVKNRKPLNEEIAMCSGFVLREIEVVKPKVVICLGSVAASTFIHPNFKITEEHGHFFDTNKGYKLIAIYHPSYILHKGQGTPEQHEIKLEVWNDMQLVDAYIKQLKTT